MVERVQAGESVAAVAAGTPLSERSLWKWVGRERAEGRDGLRDRSSRPIDRRIRCAGFGSGRWFDCGASDGPRSRSPTT